MPRMRHAVPLSLLLLSLPLFAQQTTNTITPSSGPAAGGQEVIVKGDFGTWPYSIIFGSSAVPAERLDEHTLRAITPPHPAGTVPITIFEYDMGLSTDLTYTFTGAPSGTLERILLPIFLGPINGAHGSQFRTDFRAANLKTDSYVMTHGLLADCPIAPNCTYPSDLGFTFGNGMEVKPDDVIPSGRPGAFIYVPKGEVQNLMLQLRAYDVSRDATNFGTQIPVVHEDEMATWDESIVLLNVPTDPRFRNTLRVYADRETSVILETHANGVTGMRRVDLRAPLNAFDPAYAEIADLPTNVGPMRIRVLPPWADGLPPDPMPEEGTGPQVWAFVSVTNNETQHITVISPQR